MIQDRDYQSAAVQAIWDYFIDGKGNPIVAMPTGSGKSVVIARFLQRAFAAYARQRILILTHVKELLVQNYHKLMAVWNEAPAGLYSAGLGEKDMSRPITFAGIASIYKLAEFMPVPDLIIIDECHLISPNDETMYRVFIDALKRRNPRLRIIGLTATPFRLGQGMLTEPFFDKKKDKEVPPLFTNICFDLTTEDAFNWMLAQGYLLPLIPKRTKTFLDTTGVHTRAGEYVEKELQRAVNTDEINWSAMEEAVTHCQDRRKWLIFAAGIEHAHNVGGVLTTMGVSNGVVTSDGGNRDEVLQAHKQGHIRAVINNNILTTGYDDPEIDLIIVLRPTLSPVLWTQLLGRGTRPWYMPGYDLNTVEGRLASIAASPKQNCMVLDYAGNTKNLGAINNPLIPKAKGKGVGTAPMKCCDRCDTWTYASTRICQGMLWDGTPCGYEFEFQTKLMQGASTKELVSGEWPIIEVVKVDYVNVDKHTKAGAAPMARVAYYCGLQRFQSIVCFEHQNYAGRMAKEWWRKHTNEPFPESTEKGIEAIASKLSAPTHLRVWVNKKPYPEVMAYCFDGSAFGEQDGDGVEPPVVTTDSNRSASRDLDDDIPF